MSWKEIVNRKISPLLLSLGALLCVCSCETGPEYVEDYDLVVTAYDEEFDFSTITSYSLADSVIYIGGEDLLEDDDHKFDESILNKIEDEMDALGYVRIYPADESSEIPDVVLMVSALSVTYVGGIYYPCGGWWDYWDYWWGWYPGIGPGWCTWYGYNRYYSWDEGTILIEMLDMGSLNTEDETISVLWNSLVNGILVGSDSYIESRLENSIEQAFLQSDYLGAE